jgi:hypothetical protein
MEKIGAAFKSHGQGVDMAQFMEIVDLPYWADIEEKFEGKNI